MNELLGTGEFSIADKVQAPEHLEGRLRALRKLYRSDPGLAASVVSYGWPHPQKRPWTEDELAERLGVRRKVGYAVAEKYLKTAAAEFVDSYLPSVGAAWDAFEQTREQQAARRAAEDAQRYPALAMTQPMMASYMLGQQMGSGDPTTNSQPSPHHHHRHHG